MMRNTNQQFNALISDRTETTQKYHPVPDGRFYTKANFFTMQDRTQADAELSDEKIANT
jgi:hypothetical protein